MVVDVLNSVISTVAKTRNFSSLEVVVRRFISSYIYTGLAIILCAWVVPLGAEQYRL